MDGHAKLIERGDGFTFGSYEEVFVGVWHRAATLDGAGRVARAMDRFAVKCPRGMTVVIVLEPDSGSPDGPTRDALAREMKRLEPSTRRLVAVYEGSGFKAAVMRSVLIGLQLLSRSAAPTRVFATVADAGRWLREHEGPAFDARAFESAVAELRR